MTAVISIHCRKCGTPLRDRFSRTLGYGPECRKDMTAGQIADAVRANQPGYIPQATPPVSLEARRNHAELQHVVAPMNAYPDYPERQQEADQQDPAKPTILCAPHGGVLGSCALCRRDNDPKRITDRIIAAVQRIPMDQRLAAQRAAAIRRYHPDHAHQLTIGDPT